MQEATPTTLAVAGAMRGALLLLRLAPARRGGIGTRLALGWPRLLGGRRRPFSWPLAVLALGGFGLIVIPVVILHQGFICGSDRLRRRFPARAPGSVGWTGGEPRG